MHDDGYGGQDDHREETVTEHTHHATNRDTTQTHQIQHHVHAGTPHQPDPINVAKMHLPRLQEYVTFQHSGSD